MKRALSGDKIHILSFCTIKSGSPMVAQQGQVMRGIASMVPHHLPKIYYVGPTWYAMQTIIESAGPASYRIWDWRVAEVSMWSYWAIPESWIYSDAPQFNPRALYDYVEEQGNIRDINMPSLPFLNLNYGNAVPRLTHGDLTHENTVIQYDGPYKFIDWQAQRHPYIPAHSDVDYGKMMQSLIGWGKDSPLENAIDIQALLKKCPMAWFWCAIHFMRIKKRAKEDWQRGVCEEAIEYCAWIGEKEKV